MSFGKVVDALHVVEEIVRKFTTPPLIHEA